MQLLLELDNLRLRDSEYHQYGAAVCAGEQDMYWEMYSAVYSASDLSVANLKQLAADLGLDSDTFDACLDSGEKAEEIIYEVINMQSIDVDTVSGATYSSKVILKAIENALIESD